MHTESRPYSNYLTKTFKTFYRSKFKARKMPDMSVPFMVFKNDKQLTMFHEFDLTTTRNDISEQIRKQSVPRKSQAQGCRKTVISGDCIFTRVGD